MKPRRQIPSWSELRQLLQFRPFELNRTQARLRKAADINDLRRLAKSRTPRPFFDYVDGGANDELSLERNQEAFSRVEFCPGVLRDVSSIDLKTTIGADVSSLPFGIAPTGFTRLMHTEGELAGVAAAQRAGIPFTLATMGTTSIEDLAMTAPTARKWFQLYLWRDKEKSRSLIERARNSGFDTLMLTVDTPVAGLRLRDARNGMTVPPAISLRTLFDIAQHPGWWMNFISTAPPKFASLNNFSGELAELVNSMYDPSLNFNDLKWIRNEWKGQLFIKGIQSVQDAVRVMDLGADGIVLSNHGGRQLDRAPVPFLLLPHVRKALGDNAQIIVDSGIRSGADIVAAIAAGASYTLIGRAYLYGLMAGGHAGVTRAIEILTRELTTTMQLMGVSSIADLCPDHITMVWNKHS